MRSRVRSIVRRLRSVPVIGPVVRAADRVWWARTILASPLVDAEYYSAQLGLRVGRRLAVVHYVIGGFRRGMSLNPLFDELVAGGELPEVLRVPALYAYLLSERETVSVHPWWDAPAFGADETTAPLERAWADHDTALTLRVGDTSTQITVQDYRRAALAAAGRWRRAARAVEGAPAPGGRRAVIRVVQARDRRYHRKLGQIGRRARDPRERVVVCLVAPDASQWVSAATLRLMVPSVVIRMHPRRDSWSRVAGDAIASITADTIVVLDARAELADGEIDALATRADDGALVAPASRRLDGTLAGVGAAAVGDGMPYRLLERMPPEDLDLLGEEIEVPLLTGRTFALRRRVLDHAGGLDRRLVNAGELEALSAAARRAAPPVAVRVLTSIRPVFEEPELAFSDRRTRATARVLARKGLTDARAEAEAILRTAGFRIVRWDAGRDGASPTPRLEWRRPHDGALRWSLKICAPAGRQGAVWGDRHFAEGLARALRRRGHTVVIDAFDARSRPTDYIDDVSVAIRGPYRIDPPASGIRLQWIISHPDEITRTEAARFDLVFAASRRWASKASERWHLDIRPLLECTDTDLFHPRGLTRGDDIVFVGTARGIPRPSVVVPLAAGIPVRVYGPDWRPFIPQSALAARSIAHAELPERYETASIVLNDQWPAMRREGFMAMRPFDVVAVGGRVVSEEVDDLEEVFGGAVVTYRDADHLVALLRADPAAVFPDDAELARISARIRAEHSFDARAEVLDEAVGRMRAARGEPAPRSSREANG